MTLSPQADLLAKAVSDFGALVKSALDNPVIAGQPEDQLRTPLYKLIKAIAAIIGVADHDTTLVGETKLADLMVRPDFAVIRQDVLIGFIEVKAPGKGADPAKFRGKHDRHQWTKLKALPNLIFTDGNTFSLWRDGKLAFPIVTLGGDIETSGKGLEGSLDLLALLAAAPLSFGLGRGFRRRLRPGDHLWPADGQGPRDFAEERH